MTEHEYIEQFRVHAAHDYFDDGQDDGSPEYALVTASRKLSRGAWQEATVWAAMATARQTLLNANVQHFDKY